MSSAAHRAVAGNATIGLSGERERAILVGVATIAQRREKVQEYLDELALLAASAGADVVRRVIQERRTIDATYFVGRGKADELGWLVAETGAHTILFDDDLSPVQVRNLERTIPCKIIDRSGLILDIFASRARTREAKTQVELAQLEYLLPRLTRQWTHLSKQFGGIGTKGPGETQIETDRRAIRSKISHLRTRLARIAKERVEQRKGRDRFPRVALVGYTNAGKSTLLNVLADADVFVEDRLFATLDATVRMVTLSPLHRILLSDTVGFIRKLPHGLVASFKTTLDEVREADMLLHVVDASHPLADEQIRVVNQTLDEIGVRDKPTVMVFNKTDLLRDRSHLTTLIGTHAHAVPVAAARGINIRVLTDRMREMLDTATVERTFSVSQDRYAIIARLHDIAEVMRTTYEENTVTIQCRLSRADADRVTRIIARSTDGSAGEH